jgi:hypothetical protein
MEFKDGIQNSPQNQKIRDSQSRAQHIPRKNCGREKVRFAGLLSSGFLFLNFEGT